MVLSTGRRVLASVVDCIFGRLPKRANSSHALFVPEVVQLEDRFLMNVTVGDPVNITRQRGNEAESVITVDPTNPSRLFSAAMMPSPQAGLVIGVSNQPGIWTKTIAATETGSLPAFAADPQATFDQFGNLFLTYIGHAVEQTGTAADNNGADTLRNDTDRKWTANQWTESIVRITNGAGKGQIREILESTTDSVKVSSNWTTIPNKSEYSIEQLAVHSVAKNSTGSVTSAAAQSLTNSNADWSTFPLTPFYVKITDGKGTGQFRGITNSTKTTLSVDTAWDTQPDNTSKYAIMALAHSIELVHSKDGGQNFTFVKRLDRVFRAFGIDYPSIAAGPGEIQHLPAFGWLGVLRPRW